MSAATPTVQTEPVPSTASAFATWARVYDEQVNPLLSLEERFLEELVSDIQGRTVLDVGCGTGRWLARLTDKGAQRLIGVDPSPEMLSRASVKLAQQAELLPGSAESIPVAAGSVDVVLTSFVLSYISDLQAFMRELCRAVRPNARIFVSDMHPHTMLSCGWKRGFCTGKQSVHLSANSYSLKTVVATFEAAGFAISCLLELPFGDTERRMMCKAGKSGELDAMEDRPAIYVLQCERNRPHSTFVISPDKGRKLLLDRAQLALGPDQVASVAIDIAEGRISKVCRYVSFPRGQRIPCRESIDLRGYLLFPGLINAHDHLEFGLYPNLGDGPYTNCTEWASDIHRKYADVIELQQRVPKSVRQWWGGIRNLLSGVTTVCHHNPLDPVLLDPEFPVRVITTGWSHSLALDSQLVTKYKATPSDQPFVLHAAEGRDTSSAAETRELQRLGVLSSRTILVHGLALDSDSIAMVNRSGASVVWCPSSNIFLYGQTLERDSLSSIENILLGTDSPLTATGDLLDELRIAHRILNVPPAILFHMVGSHAAKAFRLRSGQGVLRPRSVADGIAVRDTGEAPADRLVSLNWLDVELVIKDGVVRSASAELYERLPRSLRDGLSPILVDGHLRWLRANIDSLCKAAQDVLGPELRISGKRIQHVQSTRLG